MKREDVARDNAVFYVVSIGQLLNHAEYVSGILRCLLERSDGELTRTRMDGSETAQIPTDLVGKPGYLKVDISSLGRELAEWEKLAGLLTDVSYGFSSRAQFTGGYSECVVIFRGEYSFAFEIREYERDSRHSFSIISPEELGDIPESEELGRVVYLTIVRSRQNTVLYCGERFMDICRRSSDNAPVAFFCYI